jgi:prepilin-type N-terminal cleavage/methylation domain-containing protein
MKRPASQQGLTLVEMLVALAIAAALMAPLAAMFQGAAGSGTAARAALDLNTDARFVLDRIARRLAALTPTELDAALDDANALLAPVGYALSGTDLVETDTSAKPVRSSVIANNVTSFRLSAPATGDGWAVVRIDLSLASAGASVSAGRTVRLGNPI